MQIFAASYLLPISAPPIAGGAVAVENGRIVALGPIAEVRAACTGPVLDFPGSVIMPGLVNAHTHLELTHFSAWKVSKGLDYLPKSYMEWVGQVVKIRRTLTPEQLELSVQEGLRLCLESGTTSVGEILTDYSLIPLYAATPLRGRLFLELIGHDPVQCEALLAKAAQSLQALSGSLLPGASPHTPHTASPELFRGVQALATRLALKKAVHLSESSEEAKFMHDSSGAIAEELYPMAHWESYLPPPRRTTSAAYLDTLGALDRDTLAIHAVHITPSDAALLKERGATVVLCPRSNDTLSVGTAPHHLLKSLGVPLALGTDSLASNDSLSLWDEMRFLREHSPDHFTPCELLAMATSGGASALGIDGETGTLAVGKRADLQVLGLPEVQAGATLCATILEHGKLEAVYLAGECAS